MKKAPRLPDPFAAFDTWLRESGYRDVADAELGDVDLGRMDEAIEKYAQDGPNPGCFVEVADGGPWLAQDGSVTPEFRDRGIWLTVEAAQEAIEKSLGLSK